MSIARRIVSGLGKGVGMTVMAGAALLVAGELPGLRRYLHILRIAKRGGVRSHVPAANGASDAQAPRRTSDEAYEAHEDRGKERSAAHASSP